jgi:hypothetical protein
LEKSANPTITPGDRRVTPGEVGRISDPLHRDGAWGLRLDGPDVDPSLLIAAPWDWPLVGVKVQISPFVDGPDELGPDRADIKLLGGGRVRLDRKRLTSDLVLPVTPPPDAIVHPYLASTATIINYWLGRSCFHAGALIAEGGAWALLGHRGFGKSSSMAWFMLHGLPILTDDVLAVSDGQVFAGPRCLDLREEPAARLGLGRYLGWIGRRERWRVGLDDVASRYPLRGWVFLDWGDKVEMAPVPARETLSRLLEYVTATLEPDPMALLSLATLPAWEWRRPQSWDGMAGAADALLQALAG